MVAMLGWRGGSLEFSSMKATSVAKIVAWHKVTFSTWHEYQHLHEGFEGMCMALQADSQKEVGTWHSTYVCL